jgi:hypothetical protein
VLGIQGEGAWKSLKNASHFSKISAHNPLAVSLVPFFGAKERNVNNIAFCRSEPSVVKTKNKPSMKQT